MIGRQWLTMVDRQEMHERGILEDERVLDGMGTRYCRAITCSCLILS